MDVRQPRVDTLRRRFNIGARIAVGGTILLSCGAIVDQSSIAVGSVPQLTVDWPGDKVMSDASILQPRGEGVPLVALAGLKYRTCLSTRAPLFKTKVAICNQAIKDADFKKRGKVLVIPWSKSPNLVQTTRKWGPSPNFVKGCFEDAVEYEEEVGRKTVFIVVGSAACALYTHNKAPSYIRDMLNEGPNP